MHSYQPNSQQSQSHVFRIALAVAVLIAGFVLIKIISQSVYKVQIKRLVSNEDIIYPAYQQKVASESDVAKLARVANNLNQKSLYKYAALNFKRASDLDPNYRDMAYGWAYALLHATDGQLSAQDIASLHTALDQAEAVDPLYKPTLELKKLIAQMENNQNMLAQAEQRLELLKAAN